MDTASTHQLTAVTPPAGSSLGAQQLTYDAFGRLGTSTDGRGIVTSYGYGKLDRTMSLSYSGGPPSVAYTYDTAGNTQTRTDGSGTVTYGYDGLNRLTSRLATTGGGTVGYGYGYDKASNVTSLVDARGSVTYGYDDANQLTSMTDASAQKLNFAYNNDGKRVDTWSATNTGNTVWAAHSHTDYDTSGRVSRAWTARNSADTTRVFDTSYCHAAYVSGQACAATAADTGMLKYTVDNLTAARSDYTYSNSNRLTDVTNYVGHAYHYDYDVNGNRTTVKVDGVTTQTRTFNSGNQTSSTGYTYDGAGNLTHDPTAGTLAYNGAGQMTAQSGTLNGTYTHAGSDQTELVHQAIPGGTTFDYVYGRNDQNKQPVLESFAKNGAVYYLDHDPSGTPLGLKQPTGVKNFYVLDGQGSIVGFINSAGAAVGTYTYDPYGTQTGSTGTSDAIGSNPLRYEAGLADRGTGWTKYGVRYTDITTGRFTTQDPLSRLLDPDNGNRYAYAADNPTNNIDPTGKSCLSASLIAGGAILGFIGAVLIAPETLGGSLVIAGAGLVSLGSDIDVFSECF